MIRTGIGGWTYEPWRGVFYPDGLRQADELRFASRALTAIEVNGTFYGSQKAESFQKWHDETPDDFIFTLKAPRFAVNRRELAGAGDSIDRFIASGIDRLGDKLGPILWQFAATKQFAREDFSAFLKLLPAKVGHRRLRHAIEVRHDSFRDPVFLALARDHDACAVFADSFVYPSPLDATDAPTADFVYARLQNGQTDEPAGYPGAALDGWARQVKDWAAGGRDVFVFFISGGKLRAPAAATALMDRLVL